MFSINCMSLKKFRHIVISEPNYQTLKKMGNAGDSFNDVISGLLEKESK